MTIETKLFQQLEEIIHLLGDINHRLQRQENTRKSAQKKEEQDSVAQQLEEQEGLGFIKDYPLG
tara:strand:- start:180 stop:371 length:192 start_codon:yes stop_codon:yes gene_type:complete